LTQPILALDSFGKSFGERTVLHSASLWGSPGRITVLLGRNGCGKSTLIKLGVGLLSADHGTTRWAGEALRRPRLHELGRRGLFFLPDRGLLSRRLPLGEQIGFYAETFGGDRQAVAEEFRLADLLDLRVGELSGGEARRSELALVRLRSPLCLVADEPFTELAPIDRAVVAEELRAHARRGAAVIATGHEVEDLLAVADEVVWMVAGTTHILGSVQAALEQGQFRREYLGPKAPALG
jgi:ABC-type multidrug transport system ATPase subunit